MKKPIRVPTSVKRLIWWGKADPSSSGGRKILITQIFNRGDVKVIGWAFRNYPRRVLKECVANPQRGVWDGKSLSLFSGIFGVSLQKKIKDAAISSLWRS